MKAIRVRPFSLLVLLVLILPSLAPITIASTVTAWSDVWDFDATCYAWSVAYGGENFYVVGSVDYDDGTGEMVVRKYSIDGTLVWSKKYKYYDYARGTIVTYFNGDIFVGGWVKGATDTKDAIILRLDENGNVVWYRVMASPDSDDFVRGLAVYNNQLYVAIGKIKSGPTYESKVIKFELDGTALGETTENIDSIMDLDEEDGKIYVVGSSGGAASIAVYDKNLNLLETMFYFALSGYKVTRFNSVKVVKEDNDCFVYVIGLDEENPSDTIVAKLKFNVDMEMELLWAKKLENCQGERLGTHFGFPVIVGSTSKGTPASKNFYMVKISPEGEIMYEKIWGGNGKDLMYGVAFYKGYICTAGVSNSFSALDSGIVWCWKAEHTLQVELPYEKLKWLVFFKGFILPVGGGYGSGSATLPEADYAVVVDEKFEEEDTRWIFYKWSDGVEESSRQIRLFDDVSLKALYKKQYKITVESEYGTATGSGWYDEGAEATISVSPTQVQLEDDKEAVFKGWLRNGEYVSGESTLVVSVTEPAAYTAVWEVKTVTAKTYTVSATSPYATVSGTGVYEEGATATVSISPTVVDHGNKTRHVFRGWMKDGEIVSTDPSYSFEVTEDTHLKAVWRTEYLVEAQSEHGEVSGAGWYVKGATATILVSPTEVEVDGKTLVFEGWYLGEQLASKQATYSFVVDSPKAFTAKWITKEATEMYTVKVIGRYGEVTGAGTYPKGAIAEISITPTVYMADEKTRYVFAGWYFVNGTVASKEPTFKIKVNSNIEVYAKWIIEYKVDVYSEYGTASGAGWYKSGSEATISVSPTKVEENGVQYVFKGWMDENGNIVSDSPTYTFTVKKPSSFTAQWATPSVIPIPLDFTTLLIVVLVLIIIVLLIIILKKK